MHQVLVAYKYFKPWLTFSLNYAGKIKPLGYEAEPKKEDSKLGLNVVIPLNPIGIPKYDNGERFDLRLPYAERGYEDPEADVIGNKLVYFFVCFTVLK